MANLINELKDPPRQIPTLLNLKLHLGGVASQLGWLFFAIGSIFFWKMGGIDSIKEMVVFTAKTEITKGITTNCFETNTVINDSPVYGIEYKFTSDDGSTAYGISYTTGRYFENGTNVEVEYLKKDINYNRILGTRSSVSGAFILLVLTFPIIGISMAFTGFLKGKKASNLMKTGGLTYGKLVLKTRTNTSINDKPVFRMTFAFKDKMGDEYEVVTKTHLPEKLEDEQEEAIIYDFRNPSSAVVVDSLPANPSINEQGTFCLSGTGENTFALFSMILPGVAIIGNGLAILNIF